MKPDLLQFDESLEATGCLGWSRREVQPVGFPIHHGHEGPPQASVITVQQVARLAAEVAQMRAQFSQALTKIEEQLSQREGMRMSSRKGRPTRRKAEQTVLPKELSLVLDTVEKSKIIINRQLDPSDDVPLACSQETWQRAAKILIDHALSVWAKLQIAIRPPVISAGPDGSVDLYWAAAPYGLLVNVPADPNQLATYFGDDCTNPEASRASGTLDAAKATDVGILMWLAHTAEQ